MSTKYKINLSYYTYFTLLNDMEAFRFIKRNGEVNKNEFINKLIYNYYETINSDLDKFYEESKKVLINYHLKDKDINEITSSIYSVNRKIEDKSSKDYALTFVSTSKYETSFKDIETNYLKDSSFSEYIRNIFNNYATLTQDERERIIFKEIIEVITLAIKKRKTLEFKGSNSVKHIVIPLGVFNSKDRQFIYFLFKENNHLYPFNLYKIKWIKINKTSFEESELDDINNKRIDLDNIQFISSKLFNLKVRFTNKGLSMLDKIFINRPKIIKREGETIEFLGSFNQFFIYFLRFGKEIEILNSPMLKTKIKDFFKEAYEAYK